MVLYARHILPVKVFLKYSFINFVSNYRKKERGPTNNVISTSTGINGVRLAHHISKARTVTFHFYYFSKRCLIENIQEKFQKSHRQLLFLRNYLKTLLALSITVFSMFSK